MYVWGARPGNHPHRDASADATCADACGALNRLLRLTNYRTYLHKRLQMLGGLWLLRY